MSAVEPEVWTYLLNQTLQRVASQLASPRALTSVTSWAKMERFFALQLARPRRTRSWCQAKAICKPHLRSLGEESWNEKILQGQFSHAHVPLRVEGRGLFAFVHEESAESPFVEALLGRVKEDWRIKHSL